MKKINECPYCEGVANLETQKTDLVYRKESFCINQYYYKCEQCKEEYTTNETDEVSLLQAQNQYRAKYNIPFTEQIIATRIKYGIAALKMSEVLGLGANSYTNYENGDMPTPAIGTLLHVADNPVEFRKMVEWNEALFSENAFHKLTAQIDLLINEEKHGKNMIRIDLIGKPCALNGFRSPNAGKISNLFCIFLDKCNPEFNDRLKLNKLLFYADFLNFKETSYSITGLSYRAVQHGPVPSFYDNLFVYLSNENIIQSNWEQNSNGGAIERFTPVDGYDPGLFSPAEIHTIRLICDTFKNTSSWAMRNLSHEETGWIASFPQKEIIDYQKYAFDLKIAV